MEQNTLDGRSHFPLGGWILERFHPLNFTVVSALLMAAVFNLHPLTLGSGNFATYFFCMFLMAMQFRLLDDITDHQIDKLRYPERTLSKSDNIPGFWVLYYCLFLFNTMILWFIKIGDPAYMLFAGFAIVVHIWRKFLRPYVHEYMHSAIKMLKYPIFVVILMPDYMRTAHNQWFIFVIMITYLAFLIYDYTVVKHVKNDWLANVCHISYAAVLLWGAFVAQTYAYTENKIFIGILCLIYALYFYDYNAKRNFPDGFIILYTMILLVFFELKGFQTL